MPELLEIRTAALLRLLLPMRAQQRVNGIGWGGVSETCVLYCIRGTAQIRNAANRASAARAMSVALVTRFALGPKIAAMIAALSSDQLPGGCPERAAKLVSCFRSGGRPSTSEG